MQYHTSECNIIKYFVMPSDTMQYGAIIIAHYSQYHDMPYNPIQYHTIPCSIIQHNTIPYKCNTRKYHTMQFQKLYAILYNTMQYNTLQYGTIQIPYSNTIQCPCNTIQCCAIQYNAPHYKTIPCNTIQDHTIPYNTIQFHLI